MRDDPGRLGFEIDARDGAARSGRLRTAHGLVETPAFIPLATRGAVRSLDFGDVAGLGYELVLANTFHLFLAPGAERIAALGGFSPVRRMGPRADHGLGRLPGLLARPRDHRRRDQGAPWRGGEPGRGARDRRARGPVPVLHRRLGALPRAGGVDVGAGGARLRHRPRLRRVHALSRRPRVHRALDRAHASLARALPRLARRARVRQSRLCSGSSRAACTRTCAASQSRRLRRRASMGSRSVARSAATRMRCAACSSAPCRCSPPTPPPTCSESVSRTISCTGSGSGSTSSTVLCRPASLATGPLWRRSRGALPLRHHAARRWHSDPGAGRRGFPCPTCASTPALPSLPGPSRAADRRAAADASQPQLPRAPRRGRPPSQSAPAASRSIGGGCWQERRPGTPPSRPLPLLDLHDLAVLRDLVDLVDRRPVLLAAAAVDRVLLPVVRLQLVVVVAAADLVLPGPALDLVLASAAGGLVLPLAAVDLVLAALAFGAVLAVAAGDGVVALAALELVVAPGPVDDVVVAAGIGGVVAILAVDVVVPGLASELVVSRRAEQLVVVGPPLRPSLPSPPLTVSIPASPKRVWFPATRSVCRRRHHRCLCRRRRRRRPRRCRRRRRSCRRRRRR